MKTVSISTKTVGQNFGTVAVLVNEAGRTLVKTSVRPHGFEDAARAEARDIAARKGWRVEE